MTARIIRVQPVRREVSREVRAEKCVERRPFFIGRMRRSSILATSTITYHDGRRERPFSIGHGTLRIQ